MIHVLRPQQGTPCFQYTMISWITEPHNHIPIGTFLFSSYHKLATPTYCQLRIWYTCTYIYFRSCRHGVWLGNESLGTFHSYTASINCCKKTFYCNDYKITEFGITDKNSSTAYIILYKWIDTWFLDSDRRVGVWSLPWRWHILSIPLTTGRGTSAETCGLDDVFPPDDLGSRPETLC